MRGISYWLVLILSISLVTVGCEDDSSKSGKNDDGFSGSNSVGNNTVQTQPRTQQTDGGQFDTNGFGTANDTTDTDHDHDHEDDDDGYLTIEFHRVERDEESKVLVIKGTSGSEQTVSLNDMQGRSKDLKGLCQHSKLTVSFKEGGVTYATNQAECAVGRNGSATSVYLGFDDECDETGGQYWQDIDDIVLEFSCVDRRPKIDGLHLNDNIAIDVWL